MWPWRGSASRRCPDAATPCIERRQASVQAHVRPGVLEIETHRLTEARDPDLIARDRQVLAVDDTLTEADLPELGSRLQLPPGWSFRARVVSEDYVVEDQDGVAIVLQDELANTYQLAVDPERAVPSLPIWAVLSLAGLLLVCGAQSSRRDHAVPLLGPRQKL